MPLPTNNSRPALPYVPAVKLPFYNRYSSLGMMPPTAEMFDADFDALIDILNAQAAYVNGIVVGALPGASDPLNANRLMMTDGNGNISWTLVNALNLAVNTIQTQHIQDLMVTTAKIGLQAVGTLQLADGAVTTIKLADLSVSNSKIQLVPLTKTQALGNACLVVGQLGSTSYGELSFANRPWTIATVGDDGRLNAYPLYGIWSKTTTPFDGSKLGDTTIPLSKLNAGTQTASVLGSGAGTNNVSAILAPNNAYSLLSGGRGKDVGFREISNVLNNAPRNQTLGTLLQDNTVPYSKLQTLPGQVAPFAMGYVQANGNYPTRIGLTASRSGTGTYPIVFTQSAINTTYIVQLTPDLNNVGGGLTMNVSNRNVNGFTVTVTSGSGILYDCPFSVLVYSF